MASGLEGAIAKELAARIAASLDRLSDDELIALMRRLRPKPTVVPAGFDPRPGAVNRVDR